MCASQSFLSLILSYLLFAPQGCDYLRAECY